MAELLLKAPLGISSSSHMLVCLVSPFTPLLLPSRCLGSQLSLSHVFKKTLENRVVLKT